MMQVLGDGEILPVLSNELDTVSQKYDVHIDQDVKVAVAYALEERNLRPEQVPALVRHFLMSSQLRDCIKYNRKPTPCDFIEVWNEVGPRTR
jgi:hypothetical protein